MRRKLLLGSILVRDGVLTNEQLAEAVLYQQERGSRLGEVLLTLGLCTEVQIKRALAEQIDMPFVDLERNPPHPRMLQVLPRRVAVECGVVPIRTDEGRLTVVARNPFDFSIDEVVRKAAGMPVMIACGVESQIEEVLGRYDDLKAWREAPGPRDESAAVEERLRKQRTEADLLRASEAPAVAEAVEALLQDLARRRASEIQFEATAEALYVQGQVNGRLARLASFPRSQIRPVLTRVKSLARLDLADQTQWQEGTLEVLVGERPVVFRVHTQPQLGGERLSLEPLTPPRGEQVLEELRFSTAHQAELRSILRSPHGLFVVGGPTGAVVTQTALALGAALNPPSRKVVTLSPEAPLDLPGAENVVYTRTAGGSPEQAVRLALERLPAALILSSVPDAATLAAAAGAADRCLVIAGVQTPRLLPTLLRYQEDGRPTPLPAGRMLGALTVQPMRRVCDACSIQYEPEADVLEALTGHSHSSRDRFRRGRGCESCRYRGTRGRIGVYELFTAQELQTLLLHGAEPRVALPRGHRTARDDASWKAREGWITPEDVSLLYASDL